MLKNETFSKKIIDRILGISLDNIILFHGLNKQPVPFLWRHLQSVRFLPSRLYEAWCYPFYGSCFPFPPQSLCLIPTKKFNFSSATPCIDLRSRNHYLFPSKHVRLPIKPCDDYLSAKVFLLDSNIWHIYWAPHLPNNMTPLLYCLTNWKQYLSAQL